MEPEDEKKIEEYIQNYPSARNWFLKRNGKRRYAEKTGKRNLEYLEMWIKFLNKNPDEIVNVSDEEARNELLIIYAELIKLDAEESEFQEHSYKLRDFLRHNGVKLKPLKRTLAIRRARKMLLTKE